MIIQLKTEGYSARDELYFEPQGSSGSIRDGVIFDHDKEGRWVLSFNDLERCYELAKKARANSLVKK